MKENFFKLKKFLGTTERKNNFKYYNGVTFFLKYLYQYHPVSVVGFRDDEGIESTPKDYKLYLERLKEGLNCVDGSKRLVFIFSFLLALVRVSLHWFLWRGPEDEKFYNLIISLTIG